jgi:hypothetical protein
MKKNLSIGNKQFTPEDKHRHKTLNFGNDMPFANLFMNCYIIQTNLNIN